MNYVFNKSAMGYLHKESKTPCQDYSASYKDSERTIITCCDGHGGKIHIRSHVGSHMASNAIINVFRSLSYSELKSNNEEEIIKKIKLNLLCDWNRQVEEQIGRKPISKSECRELTINKIDALKDNPSRAFGTTMTGAMVMRNKLVVVGIGDTEVIGVRKGKRIRFLEDENDPAANVTYSMCQEEAFKYLRVKILDWRDYDGVFLCTDGLSGPYQSYENFDKSFIKPVILKTLKTDSLSHVSDYVDEVANKIGIGDDVSLSFILKDGTVKRHYK
ncbi:MAG: protein phosphatase 2C domain-containing protein [Clostridiales bacterium]|nr:protein phosphatase 2C domain-containing protein [Clostridiales bacterium]